jgi:multiple sugar transport system permease protein
LLLASMAGYGLARIPYKHADKVFYAVMATLMIPAAVSFIPSFIVVSSLGWVSTLRGMIIPTLFSGFAAFLFRQYFLGFPKELEEAARVDGAGYFTTFWRIVVPNSLPFFAAIAAITFIGNWNSFIWPLVIGQDEKSWTVQVAMSTFITAQTVNIHQLFMAAAVSILPLVLIFAFLQRYLIQGVTQSGIKD